MHTQQTSKSADIFYPKVGDLSLSNVPISTSDMGHARDGEARQTILWAIISSAEVRFKSNHSANQTSLEIFHTKKGTPMPYHFQDTEETLDYFPLAGLQPILHNIQFPQV